MTRNRPLLAALLAAGFASGCTVGPAYRTPEPPFIPAAYKEAPGWVPAAPADAAERGPWWELFQDPGLTALAACIEVSNQNVAAAAAAYAQARAIVREQRAAFFPSVSLNGDADRSGGKASSRSGTRYQATLGLGWEPDVWGRLRDTAQASAANAQASAADLAAARLSAQGELATNYFSLRQTDAQRALVEATLAGYDKSRQIARNRYAAGVAPKADVLQAETLFANTRAEAIGLARQRAQLEHAIAVLIGDSPSRFSLPPEPPWGVGRAWPGPGGAHQETPGRPKFPEPPRGAGRAWPGPGGAHQETPGRSQDSLDVARSDGAGDGQNHPSQMVPEVPAELPSHLLQRRPDIASTERRVAAANAQIGIERSAYFPSLSLSGSRGVDASRLGDLFTASSSLWSLGISVAQTLFNGGLTDARVAAARAGHEQAVARYRQTVLQAFQDVENQLVAIRVLAEQETERRQASGFADEAEQQVLNRYRAGQVSYAEVIDAQLTALNARRALSQLAGDRQLAAVALIQALGGDWAAR